jgi:hypothetical protein
MEKAVHISFLFVVKALAEFKIVDYSWFVWAKDQKSTLPIQCMGGHLYVSSFFSRCLHSIIIGPYIVLWALICFVRIYRLNSHHVCILGIGRPILIPMLALEGVINIYMTLLFLNPLRKLYSFKTNANPGLHTMARRTFIGSIVSLTSTIVNLGVLCALNGEYVWICFMMCNTDGKIMLLSFSKALLIWQSLSVSWSSTGSLTATSTALAIAAALTLPTKRLSAPPTQKKIL